MFKFVFTQVLLLVLALSISLSLVEPNLSVFAQSNQTSSLVPQDNLICGGPCPLINGDFQFTREGLFTFILGIARFLTFIGVALAVLYLVFAGIQFIIGRREQAKNNITTTLIGLVVIIIAYTAVTILVNLLQSNVLGSILGGQNSGSSDF